MKKKILSYYQSLNIMTKLVSLSIVIIIIPLFVGTWVWQQNMRELVTENMILDADRSLKLIKKDVEGILSITASTVQYISEDEIVNNLLEYRLAQLQESDKYAVVKGIRDLEQLIPKITYGRLSFRANIYVASSSGIIYSTAYSENDYEQSNNLFDVYMQEYDTDNDGYIGEYIYWKGLERKTDYSKSKEIYVVTAIKAINKKHQTIGMILIDVQEEVFKELLSYSRDGNTRILLDQNNNIITTSDNKYESSFIKELSHNIKDAEGTIVQDHLVISYNEIYSTKWKLLEIQNQEENMHLFRAMTNGQFILFFISLLVFILIAILGIRSITRPIKNLSEVMKETNLDYKLDNNRNANEVRVLEESYNIMVQNIKDLIETNIHIEKGKRALELKALQAQINPHFLFNTLGVIRFGIMNGHSENAEKMVMALIKLLDATIYRNDDKISLRDEIDITINYLEIIRLRKGMTIETTIEIEEGLEQYEVPRLILQPIVENSVIHGFEGSTYGSISIKAYTMKDKVYLEIEDDGVGFDKSKKNPMDTHENQFSGIGVLNVDERIKLYYGNRFGIKMESIVTKGTKVCIELPKIME